MRPSARRRLQASSANWAKQLDKSLAETEPQDLRVIRRHQLPTMEQSAETNGCDNGPIALTVSNHADAPQGSKVEKTATKSLPSQPSKTPTSSSVKNSRSRRILPVATPNTHTSSSSSSTSHASERRTTRHLTTSPLKTPQNEKKTHQIPATNALSSKKLATPASSAQQLQHATTVEGKESPEVPVVTIAKVSRRLHQASSTTHLPTPGLKRHLKSSASHHHDTDNPRASKRIRLQHQPFQSPPPPTIIPAILRQQIAKTPDDKICVFQKGEFLAVRNENGSFFVCRTAQNVYKSSKRFKIQWMSDKESDIYIPDFYDQTDFECVLTNLRLKRVDKNKYKLPSDERQRTLNILQRALNVENGMDISKLQVTTDGVDVSIVGKEEEEVLKRQQQNLLAEQRKKLAQQTKSKGKTTRQQPELKSPPKITRSSVTAQKKVNTLAARVKLRSRATVKVKLKKEGGKVIVSNKAGKPVPKLKKVVERLHPNNKVTLFEKDPTFQMNFDIPYVSSLAHSKLLIRAILLKDINMLNSLLKDTQRICSLDCCRSVDVQQTPLMYAVLEEDHRAIRALLSVSKKVYTNPPETLLEYQSNPRQNIAMLGFAVRPVQMSRGGREGNNAFLKDLNFCSETYPQIGSSVIKEALRAGVSVDTLNVLHTVDMGKKCPSYVQNEVHQYIAIAIRNGHHKLAGQLVSEALDHGGYGFGALHKEVLTKECQPLSKFKAVSVTKKAIGRFNAKITPLHCAAINPNPQYLAALLSISPEYTIADDSGWRLLHYASVCKSTGPLELLISRGIPLEEVDCEGNTPLHTAACAGRAHNVDLIARHIIASEHGRQEPNVLIGSPDKFIAMIDRGNKKSFTPLHLACQNGHIDVVRVLLRHKANVDKLTNAQHEKLTALMLASQKGHLDIVQFLIEQTARVEMKDKKQRTALTHAVINGHANITSYLLRLGANPNSTDSSGNTLVHYAAAYGWYFCLKLLIEAGASLNLPNDWKITPLSLAFMKGHMGIVDYLVEQPGIDINVDVNNDSGMTLVMQALRSKVNHSMLERIHFLVVKQKSDCSKVDYMSNNALHHLVLAEVEAVKREIKAQHEHDALVQEIAKLLLEHKCDPMFKNKEGESPFNMAVKEGCLLLVKMFLDAGCQLSLDISASGDNILHYLVSHACNRKVEPMLHAILIAKCLDEKLTPHQLLCQMAKMYNKKGHTPLLQALNTVRNCHDAEMKNRLLSFMKFLLDELGADVAAACKDENDKDTSFALHLATLCRGGSVIEILLSHKAPLNSLNCNGQTPLILAIKEENVEAIEALIKAGAVVNTKSKHDGNLSPLLLASKSPKLGRVVQLLVQNKADVNETDPKNKNTALHYVVSIRASDVLEITKALLTAGANVNALNDKRRTPLHLAVNASSSVADSSYAVEECLIGFCAEVDILDCRQRMPLHYAFTKIGRHQDKSPVDPMELVVLLVDAMPQNALKSADMFGQTVLHAAAYRGATISCMHLAKRFEKDLVDIADKNGNTALGLAVKNGHESCALMLLQCGADCTAELVDIDEDQFKQMANTWEWRHIAKQPSIPKRHFIIQETLLRDWQGILYLMVDKLESGKGVHFAVEAALKVAKYNVALKLISKIKHNWLMYNEVKSLLHDLAASATAQVYPELQIKVAQIFIEKGIPVMARDRHGCSVLTYAVINWNHPLCNFFGGKISMPYAAKLDPDASGRTSLTAVLWKLTEEDLPSEMRAWCVSLVKAGSSFNVLTRYPIVESPFPGVVTTTVDALHMKDPSVPKSTPLIRAMYKRNYMVVKFLINQGADINFPDERLQTPIMHAVKMNDMRMVKLLFNVNYDPLKDKNPGEIESVSKISNLSLTEQDVQGYTVVHHMVCPLPDYCYADCSLLHLLAEHGAPLETTNKAGETPLSMATKLQRKHMIYALHDLLKIPQEQKASVSFDGLWSPAPKAPEWEIPQSKYMDDSKQYLAKIEADSMDVVSDKPEFGPDALSGMVDNGEVVMDAAKDIPYDILMTVVDLNYGAYGIYNFYKMQIIKHKIKDLYVLFTSWGRVGDVGQVQKTPFGNLNDALKEFCRIFKTKSGNQWDDVLNFQPQPKKYRLVQLEKRKKIHRRSIKMNLESNIPTKLDEKVADLMDVLVKVHLHKGSLHDLGLDTTFDVLPFGKLSESALMEAHDLLKEISDVIKDKDSLQQNVKSQEKFSELMHKIVKLSEEFYQLLPIYGYQYERLTPLFCTSDVHEKLVLISNLLHIGLAGEMLIGAHSKIQDVNPREYVYRSLSCQLHILDKDSQEAQMILQYIHNTSLNRRVSVECIYGINWFKEDDLPKLSLNSNRMLLWHGTRLANLLSILTRGLQTSPLGVQISGNLFGKGIYLSDMFVKSENYCCSSSNSTTKCILLCEVELGDMKTVDSSVVISSDDEYDSIKALGHTQPNPAECVSWKGLSVPLGHPIYALDQSSSSSQHRFLNFNEYVVYKSSQVRLRYLIKFHC